MEKKLNVAVIGLGMGRSHAHAVEVNGHNLVAICEINEADIERAIKEFNFPRDIIVDDWKSLVNREDIDAVIIAVSGVVFQSLDLAVYAVVALAVSTKIIDNIVEGFDFAKQEPGIRYCRAQGKQRVDRSLKSEVLRYQTAFPDQPHLALETVHSCQCRGYCLYLFRCARLCDSV